MKALAALFITIFLVPLTSWSVSLPRVIEGAKMKAA